jgi:hypothetical protein
MGLTVCSALIVLPAAEKAAKQARKERLLHKQAPPHAQALFGNGSLLQLQQQLIGLVSAPHACSPARQPAVGWYACMPR